MALFGGLSWRLLGIAAGLLTVVALATAIKRIGHLEAQLDAATEIANANAAIAEEDRRLREKALAIAAESAAAAERTRQRYAQQRREIADAPQTTDGSLAPVLRRALDGLPESPVSTPSRPAAAHSAAGYADLPGRPDPAAPSGNPEGRSPGRAGP